MSLTANTVTINADTAPATATEAQPPPIVRINHVLFLQTVPRWTPSVPQWTPCTIPLTRPAHVDAEPTPADDPPGYPTYTALDGHAVRDDLNVPPPLHSVIPAGAVLSRRPGGFVLSPPNERAVGPSWLLRIAAVIVALLGIGGGL